MVHVQNKVYLICGQAGSGKNTFSLLLKKELENKNLKVCEIGITRTLKSYLKDYFGWDGNEDNKPRTLLQELGTEVIRKELGMEDFHINHLIDDIKVLSKYFDVFIVSDIRLPHEIEVLNNVFNCVNIKVIRNSYNNNLTETERNHITETALLNYDNFDYKIENIKLEDLEERVLEIVSKEV